jgi:nitrate reductase NapE component
MRSDVKQPLAKADEIALVRRNFVVVMLLFIVAAGVVDAFGFVF